MTRMTNYIPSKGKRFVPGRKKYCIEKVQKMRAEMANRKSNREGISDSNYQNILGKLQAAGHMKINGFRALNLERKMLDPFLSIPNNEDNVLESYSVSFDTAMNKQMKGNRPHMTGYLTSAHSNDKEYKLKGWFNEDGTIRLLITT